MPCRIACAGWLPRALEQGSPGVIKGGVYFRAPLHMETLADIFGDDLAIKKINDAMAVLGVRR